MSNSNSGGGGGGAKRKPEDSATADGSSGSLPKKAKVELPYDEERILELPEDIVALVDECNKLTGSQYDVEMTKSTVNKEVNGKRTFRHIFKGTIYPNPEHDGMIKFQTDGNTFQSNVETLIKVELNKYKATYKNTPSMSTRSLRKR